MENLFTNILPDLLFNPGYSFSVADMLGLITGHIKDMLPDLAMAVYFTGIKIMITELIRDFAGDGVGRMTGFVGTIALTLTPLWFTLRGYNILTGKSREPMSEFLAQVGKIYLILIIATSGSIFNEDIQDFMWDMRDGIYKLISNERHGDIFNNIDGYLLLTQALMIIPDKLNAQYPGDSTNEISTKTVNNIEVSKWVSTFGSAGPVMVAGTLNLSMEFALALSIIFGPLMIMSLMFESTKQLFWQWAKFTAGTMFCMGVMAFCTKLAFIVMASYAIPVLLSMKAELFQSVLGMGGQNYSLIQSCMLLGGLGLVLTLFLVSAPVMAYQFFQGALGFTQYSAFSPQGALAAQGKDPNKTGGTVIPPTEEGKDGGKTTIDTTQQTTQQINNTTKETQIESMDHIRTGDQVQHGLARTR